ncbi:hypothetical protein CFC21_083525 [Triticum aestivum]|uniref:Uncharacterized protein n=3 Tax=Triticum TaxID=4564 RepID=A0A9R0Y1X0_TRITD|nr:hypothetical protein CFC21_083525 [Triticum aestivum]VAI46551.1 unnamed protein product [Triticum turgidum subsp. durum]
MLKRASEMCEEIVEFCNEYEAAVVDAVAALPTRSPSPTSNPGLARGRYHRTSDAFKLFDKMPNPYDNRPSARCPLLPVSCCTERAHGSRCLLEKRGASARRAGDPRSASHLPPFHAATAQISVLETRRQKQVRDHLIATMDPALKAYLDKMSDEATARANKQDGDNNAILQALATQTARIDSLVTWKPELEARFTQLELSVAALQAASSSTAPSIGSPPLATPPMVAREIQGQSGHDAPLHPGGSSSVIPESPATSPVTDGQRSRLTLLGQMKMEDEIPGETPSPGTPGADDGGAAGIATLLEGIILGSAWVTCGGACCGMVVVVVRPDGPMVGETGSETAAMAAKGKGYDQNGLPYYTGYPAGDDQNAMHFYLVAYAATAVGVPATDAVNMDGNAGSPAGAGQAESIGRITLASDAPPVAAIDSPK